MSINQQIAQGFAPIGRDLPEVGNMLQQMQQNKVRNALAEQDRQIDVANAGTSRINAVANSSRVQADMDEATRQRVGAALDNLQTITDPAQYEAAIQEYVRHPLAQQYQVQPAELTPQGIPRLRARLGIDAPKPDKMDKPGNPFPGVGADGKPGLFLMGPDGKPQPTGLRPVAPSRGAGISMTTPDGSTIQIGGDPNYAPNTIGAPTKNKLEEAFNNAQGNSMALAGIMAKWRPEFSNLSGRWAALRAKGKDYLDIATPQEKQYLSDFSSWRADTSANLSSYLNQLSGAAISPAEEARLRAGMPNDQDSPTEFKSKADATAKRFALVQARAAYILSNPTMRLDSVSIDQMSRIIVDQANKLAMAYMNSGVAPDEAKRRASAETRQQYGLQ